MSLLMIWSTARQLNISVFNREILYGKPRNCVCYLLRQIVKHLFIIFFEPVRDKDRSQKTDQFFIKAENYCFCYISKVLDLDVVFVQTCVCKLFLSYRPISRSYIKKSFDLCVITDRMVLFSFMERMFLLSMI